MASMSSKTRWGFILGSSSVAINIVLFGFKFWVGQLSDSVSLVADAWHTLSDSLTSLIVILGFWVASRPSDEKHPFGHGRAESVGAIIIGTLLAVVGVTFFREAIMKLLDYEAANFGLPAIIVTAACILVKEGMAQFSIRVGKKTKSTSLKADGWHHRSDAITSVMILAGIFVGRYLWWIDSAMGMVVAGVILYASFSIIKDATSTILGECPDKEVEEGVMELVRRVAPEVFNAHHIHIHNYGEHMEVTLHLCLPPAMSVDDAHNIADRVEKAFADEMGADATIHVDPYDEKLCDVEDKKSLHP